jgi:N-acetylmuramoyl-L-alanine amidase
MTKIAIDPGHGNSNRKAGIFDPGAVSGSATEADIVLQWALTGKWVLSNEFGIAVWLTRDDDSDPTPVSTRDDKAEAAGCTHFLSIHCNAATPQATGTETYYRDGVDKIFAQKVQAAAVSALGLRDRGLKIESAGQHSRLAIFNFDGPAALLETGFIDNTNDRRMITTRDCRVSFWRALGTALKANT